LITRQRFTFKFLHLEKGYHDFIKQASKKRCISKTSAYHLQNLNHNNQSLTYPSDKISTKKKLPSNSGALVAEPWTCQCTHSN